MQVLSRFFFGFYAVKVIAFFNVLACIGWSSVNVIVGAQLLNTVNSNVPGYAGIIIIAALTFLITLFGYKVVHFYEFWSWIPAFIVFLIVLGEFAHTGDFINIPMSTGRAESGSVLSFAASVFGFATGWTSYAADYTVYQPAHVSRVKTFLWTYAGLIFPLTFTQWLGLAVATATTSTTTTAYLDGYENSGIGGLLGAVLQTSLGRFGDFCLVILALSIVANNCPNIYSLTFSLQIMTHYSQMVPRFIWTFVGTVVYCAIAIPGYSHFETVLENFMLLIVSPPYLPHFPPIFGLVKAHSFLFQIRATGSPSTKPSPSANTSSSPAAATPSSTSSPPPNCPPGSPPWSLSPWASWAPCWAWRRCGGLVPSGRKSGCPSMVGDVGFELAFGFAATGYWALRTGEKWWFGR